MREPSSDLGVAQPYQPPVDLSATRTQHGRHRAYGFYKCRCKACVDFRRSYERERWELRHRGRYDKPERRALTESQVLEIRRLADSRTRADLADWFGVTESTIGQIVRGETWRHLL